MRARLMFVPLAAAILACGGSSDSTGPVNTGGGGGGGTVVATNAVDMKNRAFTPAAIKVASGATVTWTNADGEAHNVTFDSGGVPASGTMAAGANKALVMPTAAGTYQYHCTFHAGMTGSVQVQ